MRKTDFLKFENLRLYYHQTTLLQCLLMGLVYEIRLKKRAGELHCLIRDNKVVNH